MKKKLRCILSVVLLPLLIQAQEISPATTDEFCPGTLIDFTVVVSGDYPFFSLTNLNRLSTQPASGTGTYNGSTKKTTFKFKLMFADISNDQGFTINYWEGNNPPASTSYVFKRIKSLDSYNAVPNVNIQSVNAPVCTSVPVSITFPRLKWWNLATAPPVEFGEVVDYEYKVPAGWSVNGSVASNDNDIKVAGNTVTITPSTNTGSGASVLVRAANKCAANLKAGPWKAIPVNRPKPALTFSGPTTICSSVQYSVSGAPSWVTGYTWSATPANMISFDNVNANPVTATKLTNWETAEINLTINSDPACNASFTYSNQEIMGTPKVFVGEPAYLQGQGTFEVEGSIPVVKPRSTVNEFYGWTYDMEGFNVHIKMPPASQIGYWGYWYLGSNAIGGPVNQVRSFAAYNGGFTAKYSFYYPGVAGATPNQFLVTYYRSSACSSNAPYTHWFIYKGSSPTGPLRSQSSYATFPNPATGRALVTAVSPLTKTSQGNAYLPATGFQEVQIINMQGQVQRSFKFRAGSLQGEIDVKGLTPGNYMLRIFDGKKYSSDLIIVK